MNFFSMVKREYFRLINNASSWILFVRAWTRNPSTASIAIRKHILQSCSKELAFLRRIRRLFMVKDAHDEKTKFGGISNFNGTGQKIYTALAFISHSFCSCPHWLASSGDSGLASYWQWWLPILWGKDKVKKVERIVRKLLKKTPTLISHQWVAPPVLFDSDHRRVNMMIC